MDPQRTLRWLESLRVYLDARVALACATAEFIAKRHGRNDRPTSQPEGM